MTGEHTSNVFSIAALCKEKSRQLGYDVAINDRTSSTRGTEGRIVDHQFVGADHSVGRRCAEFGKGSDVCVLEEIVKGPFLLPVVRIWVEGWG